MNPFVAILAPQVASSSDLFLARSISTELANLYGVPLKIRHVERIPKTQRFILIGSIAKPLVQQYRQAHGINASADVPGSEGYVLDTNERAVAILGCANLVWPELYLEPKQVSERVQKAVPNLRQRVSMQLWPSPDDPVTPFDIGAHLNAPASPETWNYPGTADLLGFYRF